MVATQLSYDLHWLTYYGIFACQRRLVPGPVLKPVRPGFASQVRVIIWCSRIPSVLDLVPSVHQAITVPNRLEKPAYDNSEHSRRDVSVLQVACDKLAQGLRLARTNCRLQSVSSLLLKDVFAAGALKIECTCAVLRQNDGSISE